MASNLLHVPQDPEAESSGPPSAAGACRLAEILGRGVERVVFDLDYTLLEPGGTHRELIFKTFEELGFCCEGVMRDVFEKWRGVPYELLLLRMSEACAKASGFAVPLPECIEMLSKVAQEARIGARSIAAAPRLVPGARELLKTVEQLGVNGMICTGTLRPIAEYELWASKLSEFEAAKNLFCAGDTPFEKSQPEFWQHALCGVYPDRVVGFDDSLKSAEWMLAAGISRVIFRPSTAADAQSREHDGRVLLVNSWINLL